MSFVALCSLLRKIMSVFEVYSRNWIHGELLVLGWDGMTRKTETKKMFTYVELEIVFDCVIWLHCTSNIFTQLFYFRTPNFLSS